tara:strand:+ start:238 stop:501 length:264 start_codon:yes stop_codon:yes gene_type:complete
MKITKTPRYVEIRRIDKAGQSFLAPENLWKYRVLVLDGQEGRDLFVVEHVSYESFETSEAANHAGHRYMNSAELADHNRQEQEWHSV